MVKTNEYCWYTRYKCYSSNTSTNYRYLWILLWILSKRRRRNNPIGLISSCSWLLARIMIWSLIMQISSLDFSLKSLFFGPTHPIYDNFRYILQSEEETTDFGRLQDRSLCCFLSLLAHACLETAKLMGRHRKFSKIIEQKNKIVDYWGEGVTFPAQDTPEISTYSDCPFDSLFYYLFLSV